MLPFTKEVERAAELPCHCRSMLESWGEIWGNCCLGTKWELQIFIFIWFDQTSVDVLQVGTVFSPLRDSFSSLSCTGSSDRSLPWCLICKLFDLKGLWKRKDNVFHTERTMWCWEWEYNIPAWAWFVCSGSVGCLNQVFVKQGLSDFSGRVPHLWSMSKIPLGGKSLISVLVKYWPMASPSQESSKGGQHRKTSQPQGSWNVEGVEEQLSHCPPPVEGLAVQGKVLGALCLPQGTAVFVIITERQFHVFVDRLPAVSGNCLP